MPSSVWRTSTMAAEPNELSHLRADQVGSLIRPEALRAAQDAAIRQVVAQQEALGFPIVTDGEFRRVLFQESFARSTSGWGGPPGLSVRTPVTAPLRLVHNTILDEYAFAHAVAKRPV